MNQGIAALESILDSDDYLPEDFDDDFFAEDLSSLASAERELLSRSAWAIDEFENDMRAFED